MKIFDIEGIIIQQNWQKLVSKNLPYFYKLNWTVSREVLDPLYDIINEED